MTAKIDLYFPQFAQYLASAPNPPILSRLAALGAWQVDKSQPIEMTLCETLGVRKSEDWPLAAYTRLGEGLDVNKGSYLIVHPAYFALQRDHFVYGQSLLLESGVSGQLVRLLNNHFAGDGLYFERSKDPAIWYLQSETPLNVQTSLPAQVLGRDVRGLMPQGTDALRCQTILNQVQMLFHEHPVNQMREVVGEVPVNSIWLSGCASAKDIKPVHLHKKWQIFANDLLVSGLAKNAKQPCYVLPKNWQGLMDSLTADEDALVVVDHADFLEASWFEPMWASLKKAEVKEVRCHFAVDGMRFTLTLHPRDKWKFWRTAHPLMDYLSIAYDQADGSHR